MNRISHLAPDEPLSPELVLVLPPELRAQALAALGPPVWPAPRLRVVQAPAPPAEPFARSLSVLVAARVAQLGLIFAAVTIVTLAMSLVAHAVR
ncbi:MAG TPA: hypothetical protein VFU64_04250 [Gaiellaceae bacterium]|nr:hypothetical protein [Gaiellaceae bacterium]